MVRIQVALLVLSLSLPSTVAPAGAAPTRSSAAAAAGKSVKAQSPEASCQAFVQRFYDGYLKRLKGTHHGTPSDLEIKRRPALFGRELRQRLAEDLAASARNKDEIVGLDFDPFLNSQDMADRYVARKVVRAGERYRVEVHAVTGGKQTPSPVVIPELIRSGSSWTFVNFLYRNPENPADKSDLLTILGQLRADRKKHRH